MLCIYSIICLICLSRIIWCEVLVLSCCTFVTWSFWFYCSFLVFFFHLCVLQRLGWFNYAKYYWKEMCKRSRTYESIERVLCFSSAPDQHVLWSPNQWGWCLIMLLSIIVESLRKWMLWVDCSWNVGQMTYRGCNFKFLHCLHVEM